MSDYWYNSSYGFRRRLLIIPPATQPIEGGFPITIVVQNEEWQALNKIRIDDQDIQVVYIDPDIAATPIQVAIPHKLVYPTNEEKDVYVVFNAEEPIMDAMMATPSINMDYYMYYGNPALLNHQFLSYTESDYVIMLTPDDYNFSLTFSRPTEHWIDGISSKVNARFALSFFGINARLKMKKGPDRGIMELKLDDEAPIYIDTFASVESEEIVYTTDALDPGEHVIRCRVTGDKNAASQSYALEFISFEYSIFVEAIEGPEEINPGNTGIVFITGV